MNEYPEELYEEEEQRNQISALTTTQNRPSKKNNDIFAEPRQSNQSTAMSSQADLFKFKKNLLSILGKFERIHTQQQGEEELKKLMIQDILDNDRMNIFLNCLSDINEHMKLPQIK